MNKLHLHKNRLTHLRNRKKGSAIIMVLILGFALILILISQLDRGITSRKLNMANTLYHEARNAAESWTEYGCADIVHRFESKTSFSSDELKNNPISVPTTATAFYTGSHLDLSQTEVKGGQIDPGYWIYLDEDDPRWEFDPLKGKRIFVRDVEIYAKATAKSPELNGKETIAYVRQTLQVRDNPLFSNAIFYNLDLELNPGPNMDLYGTVHTNRDMWLGVNDGSYLKFHQPISATGRIYHGDKEEMLYNPHRSGLRGDVYMLNAEDKWKNMKLDSSGDGDEDWLDSKQANWRTLSSQTWDGNVQDEFHNVPSYNAAGIKDHVPDDPTTYANELENHAYAIIEPLLPSSHPDVKSQTVRNQKMMAKAGLIFKVEFDSSTETGLRVRAYKWKRNNSSVPVNLQEPFDGNLTVDGSGNPTLVEIQIPNRNTSAYLTRDLIGVANANITEVDNTGTFSNIPQVEKYEISSGYVTRGLYDHRQDIAMSLITLDVSVLRQIVDDHANASSVNLGQEYFEDSAGDVSYIPENDWNGVVYIQFPIESNSGGAADKIVRAKPSVSATKTTTTTTTQDVFADVGSYNGDYLLYNGRYYSRWERPDWYYSYKSYFRYNKTGTTTTTQTSTSTVNYNLGLQLINGEYIPSPSFAEDPGFTLVTNAPLYVVGHYNADGIEHTNDAQKIETSHYHDTNGTSYDEPPAALFADTITLLSTDWKPSGKNNRKFSAESDKWNRKVYHPLEFSAALVTGITPTIPRGTLTWPSDGAGSGGAINLPRFLEHWTGYRATIRSSLVALFESEVQTEPYHDYFNHFYTPPVRDWGFNENFEKGIYPPGTPNVRAFRRTRFEDITAAEYSTGTNF